MQNKFLALKIITGALVLFICLGSNGYATPCKSIPDTPAKGLAFCSGTASEVEKAPVSETGAVSDLDGSNNTVKADPAQADFTFNAGPVEREHLSLNNSITGIQEIVGAAPTSKMQARLQSEIARWKTGYQSPSSTGSSGSVRPASFVGSPSASATGSSGTGLSETDPESDQSKATAVVEIPESGSLILLGAGLIGIAGIRRRREIKVSNLN